MFSKAKIKLESRTTLRLAIPAIIAQLAQMSMGTIDTIMSGRLSTEALAAIAVANSLIIPLIILVLGILMALNPMVSHAIGAKQTSRVADYTQQGVYIAIFFTIPCFLLIPYAEPLMVIIGVEESIRPVVLEYLLALRWGLLSLNLFFALRFVNEGLFSTDAIMYIALSAIPFNIALNYIFMYGYFGLPAMGAVGLGYATSIVWTLMFITIAVYTLTVTKYKNIQFLANYRPPEWTIIKQILKLAVPLSMTLFMEVFLFAAVGLLIGRYALDLIAAHQVALNISAMIYMIPLGLSIAISARVGYAHGQHNLDNCKLSSFVGICLAIIISCMATVILLSIPETIIGIYTDEPGVISNTLNLLVVAALFLIVDSIQVIAASALRGLHDTFVPMIIAGISYWPVGFSVGYYFAEIEGLLAEGYWYGFVSGLTCAAILMLWRLRFVLQRFSAIEQKTEQPV